MTARYKVEQDLSRGWTDSTRRYIIVDTTTNHITDEGFTNQKEARSWAAHLNREDRTMNTTTPATPEAQALALEPEDAFDTLDADRFICRHCGEEIEDMGDRPGKTTWVMTLSGDEGGTYDLCMENRAGVHQPGGVGPV